MRSPIEAVLPFWLDRPDLEALEIAEAVDAAGIGGLWIGEMATFDAFALATAIGLAALGEPDQVADRIRAYLDHGADTVAVIPVTADDPAGRTALGCAADLSRTITPAQETTR